MEQQRMPRVLVAGRSYGFNLCLARSFGMAGYEVEVLRIYKGTPRRLNPMNALKPDAVSKYVAAYHTCVMAGQTERVMEALLALADPEQKKLLITGDDLFANIVDENLEKLDPYYYISGVEGKAGALSHLMRKDVQKQLAREAGLPVVGSCMITISGGVFQIPDTVKYPCFVKPNVSKNGQKRSMRRCDDEAQLRQCLASLCRGQDAQVLVEDYVNIKREYSILGISTREGVIGPGFFGANLGCHEDRKGVALVGQVLPTDMHRQLIDDILRFIGTLHFEGLFDVDLIEDTDGRMYFVELNLRFGGSGYAITCSGVNLPGMYADYVMRGSPIDHSCRVKPGRAFLNEKNLMEEYMKGYLTWGQMRRLLKEADIRFIQDAEDSAPYRHFRKFYPVAAIMRILYRIKAALGK